MFFDVPCVFCRRSNMRTLLVLFLLVKSNAWAHDMKIHEQRGVVGGTTTLPCHAPPEEQQDVDFEWTFLNKTNVITDYTNDEIHNEGYERVKFIGDLTKGDASITIEDLRLDDSGVYKCEWTYYSQGLREKHTLVNLTITATALPQNGSSHIVAAVVVTLVMVISVAVAVAFYFCKRKHWFCWRKIIENNTAEENIQMNVQ
uniref:Ig-like domain-containing protein n=1 Tax=Eptatretus burgeri TaxID=7764 RepID=A0A8C4NEX8_EPTBU